MAYMSSRLVTYNIHRTDVTEEGVVTPTLVETVEWGPSIINLANALIACYVQGDYTDFTSNMRGDGVELTVLRPTGYTLIVASEAR